MQMDSQGYNYLICEHKCPFDCVSVEFCRDRCGRIAVCVSSAPPFKYLAYSLIFHSYRMELPSPTDGLGEL